MSEPVVLVSCFWQAGESSGRQMRRDVIRIEPGTGGPDFRQSLLFALRSTIDAAFGIPDEGLENLPTSGAEMLPASEPLGGGKAGEVSVMNVLAGNDLGKHAKFVQR